MLVDVKSSACVGTMALRVKVTEKKCDDIESMHEMQWGEISSPHTQGGNLCTGYDEIAETGCRIEA